MIKEIGHIASIQTGLFAKPGSKGDIVYLQAKHFDENGVLNSTLYPELKMENKIKNHLLKHGDVLFAAKGSKNFATWYEDNNKPAVASTSFFVIRILEEFQSKILPEFLVCILNNPNSQKFLKGKAIGTSIASISKSVLQELEVSIPDVSMQELILSIIHLRKKEISLKQQIESLRDLQLQNQILKAIK